MPNLFDKLFTRYTIREQGDNFYVTSPLFEEEIQFAKVNLKRVKQDLLLEIHQDKQVSFWQDNISHYDETIESSLEKQICTINSDEEANEEGPDAKKEKLFSRVLTKAVKDKLKEEQEVTQALKDKHPAFYSKINWLKAITALVALAAIITVIAVPALATYCALAVGLAGVSFIGIKMKEEYDFYKEQKVAQQQSSQKQSNNGKNNENSFSSVTSSQSINSTELQSPTGSNFTKITNEKQKNNNSDNTAIK